MDVQKVNKWWEKAMTKHQLRESHHPVAKRRFEVKTRDASVEPTSGRTRERELP